LIPFEFLCYEPNRCDNYEFFSSFAGKPGTDPISLPSQDVSTLVDTCIKDIAKRLPGHHHPVGSLAPLPQRLCLKILKHLMKKKTLTPKTLNSFVPW
jgi:hypothetical protein